MKDSCRGSGTCGLTYLRSSTSASRSSSSSCSCWATKLSTVDEAISPGVQAPDWSFLLGVPYRDNESTHEVCAASASGCDCGKMAASIAASALPGAFGRLVSVCSRSILAPSGPGAAALRSASQRFNSQSTSYPQGYVPKTSLSSPPWEEVVLPDPVEETRHHTEVVRKVNELIATGQYGRLFAVVHFASHQWKVTSEDLILIENELDIKCGERIRLEKVLLVGADNFTLLGKPLLGKDLVRVEATVIEKTESWPKINMKFRKRKNFRKKNIIVNPQTVLRINTIEIAPRLL